MTAAADRSIRHDLALRTAQDHQALHTHPWISSLAGPKLTAHRYMTLLSAYHAFFLAVEAQRLKLDAYPALSLRGPIDALASDLPAEAKAEPHSVVVDKVCPDTPPALLGALYVLHGAGFGAGTLNANVREVLPLAPREYLATGVSRELWRGLVRELNMLEADPADRDSLIQGAAATFREFGEFVTQYCEMHEPLLSSAV